MQVQSQVALQFETPPSENGLNKDGDPDGPFSPGVVAPEKPVKKKTRQWAAWTRQEEENFFNALRQVGKNFDKITCRVQSKNKDQVRHYYYRLVRRMNKLLGPGFCLDAKNSKDTNAAMLRWWSLLEKYSCTASKLHLKPRRFKIFLEALEHQLLKDRKKTKRKRSFQGDNCPSGTPTAVSLISKAAGNDSCPVKVVIVDSQNIHKVGSAKGSSLKRSPSRGGSCNKGDSSANTTTRQRRKAGTVSAAAYKRWEKAAMAGVSLVADAAEQLERAVTNRNGFHDRRTLLDFPGEPSLLCGKKDVQLDGELAPSRLSSTCKSGCSQDQVTEAGIHPSMKLKLQLFPIDEATRRALEKDEHNPHLELTLSARKKISSILEHLNRKWGSSSIASGEIMLFPFGIQQENLASHLRWTLKDTAASAADVYATIGSPAVFRLRYGWFSGSEFRSGTVGPTSRHSDSFLQCKDNLEEYTHPETSDGEVVNVDATPTPDQPMSHHSIQLMDSANNQSTMTMEKTAPVTSFPDPSLHMIRDIATDREQTLSGPLTHTAATWWLREESGHGIARKQWDDMDNLRVSNGTALSAGEWADSLTNMSIGDLLVEASRDAGANCTDAPSERNGSCLQQIPFSCASFDAAIAAHISGPQEIPSLSTQVSHSSIWDAEETCDAFSFPKPTPSTKEVSNLSPAAFLKECRQIDRVDSFGFQSLVEEITEIEPTEDAARDGDTTANPQSDERDPDDSPMNLDLTDLYWPDSLGPLDLDVSSYRFPGQDLILGDSISLSGLNRLIASSLDAFQNCSFFGSDKKESSTNDVREAAPLLDNKIGPEG